MTQWQWGWRYCWKCSNMTWNNFPTAGKCQAGGDHEIHGFHFALPFDRVTSATRQDRFFFCNKCHCLFKEKDFGGGNDLGRCPKGGQHDRTDSIEFVLSFDRPPQEDQQSNWRVCVNCNVMFFGADEGKCPAPGVIGHNPGQADIPDFVLSHSTDQAEWVD